MRSAKSKSVEKTEAAAPAKKRVTFELSAEPGSEVCVAGTFNAWSATATPMKDNPKDGIYKAAVMLPKGTYEYKFVVNGIWSIDPKCMERRPDGHGSLNSVIHV